jgi:hypothetical protein
MPATYEPIATTTLGSAATAINFSSIAATYTDLRVILQFAPSNVDRAICTFNSDTGTNYSATVLRGDGTTADSVNSTNANHIQPNINSSAGTANEQQLVIIDIFSYAGSTYKTVLSDVSADRNGAGWATRSVSLWRSTSAINRIDLYRDGTYQIKAGTTITLYGIKAA